MKKDLTGTVIDGIYSSPRKKNETDQTKIISFDDTWSSDLLDMNDNGPKKITRYRYNLVVIDNFSKFGCTIPLQNKYAQSITNAL